jgi:hypothetical protein
VGLLESRLDAIVYRAKFVPDDFRPPGSSSNHGHDARERQARDQSPATALQSPRT